jgi:dimethylargininase
MPSAALVRPVPTSYDRCLRTQPVDVDVHAAREQHRGYVAALEEAGLEVISLPRLDDAPDSVFVEDPIVVMQRTALLTRTGAPSRRGEGASIARALESLLEVEEMEEPATLDGGDVLPLGRHLFVGLTGRTNAAGIERLAAVAGREGLETVTVKVQAGLHLKSAVTSIGSSVIGLFDRIDAEPFRARGIERIEAPEEMGANVLDLGKLVLVSAAAPRTAELLAARGHAVRIVGVSEFHKGDGALTCLSVRLPSRAAG